MAAWDVAIAHVQCFVEARGTGDVLMQVRKKISKPNVARVETTTHQHRLVR